LRDRPSGSSLLVPDPTRQSSARDLCNKLRSPSTCNIQTLATLFPSCSKSTVKRKFNPDEDCIVSEQQRRKKAAIPNNRGRVKTIKVVVVKNL
jgi:hypothetical protein